MTTQERKDALRLLQAINHHEASHLITIGTSVVPSQVAHHVGLEVGSDRYNAALGHLMDEGALVEEPDYGDPNRELPPQPLSYTITSAATLMLREGGEEQQG